MINILLFLIFIHWVADFFCQTEKMATNKSKNNFWLSAHIFTYTTITVACWLLLFFMTSWLVLPWVTCMHMFIYIFLMHWITDYITSRITSSLYAKQDYHNFFVVIGFDQVLHYIQLFYVYKYFILNTTV